MKVLDDEFEIFDDECEALKDESEDLGDECEILRQMCGPERWMCEMLIYIDLLVDPDKRISSPKYFFSKIIIISAENFKMFKISNKVFVIAERGEAVHGVRVATSHL